MAVSSKRQWHVISTHGTHPILDEQPADLNQAFVSGHLQWSQTNVLVDGRHAGGQQSVGIGAGSQQQVHNFDIACKENKLIW